ARERPPHGLAEVVEERRDVGIARVRVIPDRGEPRASSQLATRVVFPEPAGPLTQARPVSRARSSRRNSRSRARTWLRGKLGGTTFAGWTAQGLSVAERQGFWRAAAVLV
ncbi:MAG: hypothetical protein L0206_17880, partial [Actinobacteria bacterium]|nr:hypothetical protein [Actinomycetota bacterium]